MKTELKQDHFTAMFYPKSIAIVGASATKHTIGNKQIRVLKEFGYNGNVYAVHPKAEEIEGVSAYPSFELLPESIDYAYIAVPAERVIQTISSFSGKVKTAHIVTSGFSEVGNHTLEQELLEVARTEGVRLIGPNCIGLYCPESRVTYSDTFSKAIGHASVFSQSGGLASDIGHYGKSLGLKFSKIVSSGNCADLGPADFLDYFCEDPKTKVIGMYIEDVKDGRRLVESLQNCQDHNKPVVIMKGARTDEGARAAASHTGALASNYKILEGICKQTGAILVESYEEMIQVLLFLEKYQDKLRNKTILLGNGGGSTVSAIDTCAEHHVNIPEFSQLTQDSLLSLNLPAGFSIKNPIDTPAWTLMAEKGKVIQSILKTALQHESYYNLVIHLNVHVVINTFGEKALDNLMNALLELSELQINMIIVLRTDVDEFVQTRNEYARQLREIGFPVTYHLNSTLEALAKAIHHTERQFQYEEFRQQKGVS